MAHNRYFIVNSDDENLGTILSYSVETKPRENNNKTKLLIKLFDEDHSEHPELEPYREYSYDEILVELQKAEWINDDL